MERGAYMPRKGENIYKRKDGRWEGRYIKGRKTDGRAAYGYVYAKTYREVKEKLRQESVFYSDTAGKKGNTQDSILGEIVDKWMERTFPKLKESTAVKYRNLLRHYILPELGKVPLNQLTYDRMEQFCNDLLSSGGTRHQGLSQKTVADTMTLLRRILRFAEYQGNDIPCSCYFMQVKIQQKEMRVLSQSEQKVLCTHLLSNLNASNIGILVCLFTGMRVGEICALRWEDISIKEQTIFVHQTMQRIQTDQNIGCKTKVIVTTPKSACSIRTIPMPEDLAQIIAEYQTSNTGYFLTGSNERYMEPRTMQNRFKAVLIQCGIRDVNYHVLRHTFATRCIELGFDVKTLSEILGHASINITMNRYVHPSMELKRKNMQRLSDFIAVK